MEQIGGPLVTIVIPYAYNLKFLQVLLTTLRQYTPPGLCNIIVMDNTPPPDRKSFVISIPALMYAPHPQDWHAGCMDYILPMITTPYFMMMESDCYVCSDKWLDNYLNAMKDEFVAMAGWFWPGDDRNYIGPGATLYNTKLVMKTRGEVLADKRKSFCYGNFMRHRHTLEPRLSEMIDKGQWGPFSETRGFHNIVIRDEKWWQEPCAWLYYRLDHEYECVALQGSFTDQEFNGIHIAAGTYYGPGIGSEIYLIHNWGGTVSHNWEKQKVVTPWELTALPWWVRREDRIWNDIVPLDIRNKTLSMGLVKTGEEEMDFILHHPNVLQEVSA